MVAVPADGQFARIAVMGLVENPEIFVKTPGAHSNILSCKNLSIQPVSSQNRIRPKSCLCRMLQKTQLMLRQWMKEFFSFKGGASESEVDLHAQIFRLQWDSTPMSSIHAHNSLALKYPVPRICCQVLCPSLGLSLGNGHCSSFQSRVRTPFGLYVMLLSNMQSQEWDMSVFACLYVCIYGACSQSHLTALWSQVFQHQGQPARVQWGTWG
jgi:hypothetical protein